ncbi:UDP-D-xylose:ribitol-5-phosphate beta1,4-xylosyltransferase [Seminavis robusta]|uniref:UDP-D-xylose:ribitol-5-phosphate beta1,4-xylosyltransferase n=1 Tax=Seminavis robusta TaxID=568900 RepID=A0A9N8D7U0_9STRA|nr:UDP-D-xylose:ribitol-5-phosphate beta1,4-xylosyltransferase [Seminavis robusta]|eukprot:Sro10_g007810.1 UDP-D-xylose:ribitol-5-phosphate beta1,4-xylosyltransferase (386) ;mRNA; r:9751-10908
MRFVAGFLSVLGVGILLIVLASYHYSSTHNILNDATIISTKDGSSIQEVTTIVKESEGAMIPQITNVTVFLTTRDNPADSIFTTGTLDRFGSGKIRYIIHNGDCSCNATTQPVLRRNPCLAVSRDCPHRALKCKYPRCKTLITNDEFCKPKGTKYDAREYYNADTPETPYIPLGPRSDSWASFQKIKKKATAKHGQQQFSIVPASKRKYAFNAIFSRSTNDGRIKLATIIEDNHNHDHNNLTVFTQMAEKWIRDVNNPKRKSGHLNTDSYMQVLLDSTFTLAPSGHNPECFRLYEAIEAGSIPVFVRDDDYDNQNCKQSLHWWFDVEPKAPIVVLQNSWEEMYPTVQKLLQDPAALDEQQARLRVWYGNYMRRVTAEFETFLLAG